MLDIQNRDESLVEIFITGKKGLNTCQTNKTSDYYQADEEWWQATYNNGIGKGEVEFDESAASQAIPLYIPIVDPETSEAIGVAKILVDLIFLKVRF